MKSHYIVHAGLVILGLFAITATAYGARTGTGLGFFPPEPQSLAPALASSYIPLSQQASDAESRRALADFATLTGIQQPTLITGLGLLTSLGDHVGAARWRGSSPTSRESMALIMQIKISDVVTLIHDPSAQALQTGVQRSIVAHYNGVKVYQLRFPNGVAYGCLLRGDAVLTSDLPLLQRLIAANGG